MPFDLVGCLEQVVKCEKQESKDIYCSSMVRMMGETERIFKEIESVVMDAHSDQASAQALMVLWFPLDGMRVLDFKMIDNDMVVLIATPSSQAGTSIHIISKLKSVTFL
jgi:hypothetical protein